MATVSQRAQQLPVSPIRRLVPFANAAKKAGKTVYHLNIGQPDICTPTGFMQGAASGPEVLAYSPSQGLLGAREALSAYYARHGLDFGADQIAVTVGGSEAVLFAIMAVCDPGDEVIVPEPFYANYRSFAVLSGVTLVPVTTTAEDGFHLTSKADIENAVTQKSKAILFCSPGNPTGVVYGREEMEWIRDVAVQHNLFMISDEVYREFVYDGLQHVSLFDLEGVNELGILVDSISKRFSACGARIGCVASHNAEVNGAIVKFCQSRLSPPAMGEHGLIHMLNAPDYESQVSGIIGRFNARRDVLYEGLCDIAGLVCRKPSGAFYAIAKLPVDNAEAFATWLLSDFDVDGKTIMLAPVGDFYETRGLGQDEVRIAYVLNRHSLEDAISILKTALQTYPGSRLPATQTA